MAANWLAGLAVSALGAVGWMAAAVKLGVAFVVSAIGSKLLGGRPPPVAAQERRESIRSPVAARNVIYGMTRVGGVLVYAQNRPNDRRYLNVVLALAHGRSEDIGPVFLMNNTRSDQKKFDGLVFYRTFLGTDDQQACPELRAEVPGEWTDAHRLRGVTYAYIRLKFDAAVFPSGLPTFSFLVKGRRVWDPRMGPRTSEHTWRWTDNAALCTLDYIMGDHGLRATVDEIDVQNWITAADVCDEIVVSADTVLGSVRRYTLNGSIDLSASPADVLGAMQATFGGHVTYSGGKYCAYPARLQQDAPYQITGADLAGQPTLRIKPERRAAFNTVRGVYREPRMDWQDADYPVHSTVSAEAEQVVETLDLPLVTNVNQAQRLARLALRRATYGQASITLPLNWSGLQHALWDRVNVHVRTLPAPPGPYRIVGWSLREGGGVDITVQQEPEAIYDWSTADEERVAYPVTTSFGGVLGDPNETSVAIAGALGQSGLTLRYALTRAWTRATPPDTSQFTVKRDDGALVPVTGLVFDQAAGTITLQVAGDLSTGGLGALLDHVRVTFQQTGTRPVLVSYSLRIPFTSQQALGGIADMWR